MALLVPSFNGKNQYDVYLTNVVGKPDALPLVSLGFSFSSVSKHSFSPPYTVGMLAPQSPFASVPGRKEAACSCSYPYLSLHLWVPVPPNRGPFCSVCVVIDATLTSFNHLKEILKQCRCHRFTLG